MKVLNNITLKLRFLAINWTFQGMAQAQSEKYVRTYQTAVILNNSVPFDDSSAQTVREAESDLKTAFSPTDHTRYQMGEYGIKAEIPPGCLGCKIEVTVYDSTIYGKKSNDFIDHEGLIYGIYMDAPSSEWKRNSFDVNNCLYDNLGRVDKPVDANGNSVCPTDYTRASDEWIPSYYASAIEHIKRKNPQVDLRRPFALEQLPVILRVTITEERLAADFALKNHSFQDSYIPGIGKVTDYFNFDEPQKREPIITTAKTGHNGTVSAEHDFINDIDPTEFDNNNGWTKPVDDTDFRLKKFYIPESQDCVGEDWPEVEVYTWVAKYEAGTQYENEVSFHIRASDVKRYEEQCEVDPITGIPIEPCTTIIINPSKEEFAEVDARVYQNATNLGRIPRILRRGVTDIYFNTKTDFVGDACAVLSKAIRLPLKPSNMEYAEILLHEAVHVTFDEFVRDFINDANYNGDIRWENALKADGRNYSEYVQSSVATLTEEQVTEHFAVFLWLRTEYFKRRKFSSDPIKARIQRNQSIDFMQNRIYYFENYLLTRAYNGVTYSSMADAIYPLTDQGSILNDVANPFGADHANATNRQMTHKDTTPEEKTEELLFNIFPNPATGQVNIIVDLPNPGPLTIQLVDMQGRTVYQKQSDYVKAGTQWIRLNDLNLPSGSYVIRLSAKGLMKQNRLLIE